jgi:hypothetical protein
MLHSQAKDIFSLDIVSSATAQGLGTGPKQNSNEICMQNKLNTLQSLIKHES